MIRKAAIIISAGIGVLLALVVLAVIGIHVYFTTGHARDMLRERVNAAIPGNIDWDDARLSLLAGQISLDNPTVKGPDGDTIIAANAIELDLGLAGLLTGTIVIENGRLESPLVQLAYDEKGNLNLLDAFREPGPPETAEPPPESQGEFPFDIRIDNLELTDGLFRFRMAPTTPEEVPQSILLEQIAVRLEDGDLFDPSGSLSVTIAGGSIALDGFETVLQQFSLEAALRDGRIEPLALDLKTTGPNLSVSGSIAKLFDEPRLDLKIDVSADLAVFKKYFELDIDLDGPVRLDVHATGDPSNPTVALKGHYGGGRLPSFSLDAIDLRARMEDWRIDVAHLAATGAPGVLVAEGTVDMKGVFDKGLFGDSSYDFETFGYDAEVSTRDFNMAKFPWTWDLLAGMVGGNIHIKGTGVFPTTMTAEATIDLTGDNFAVKDAVPPMDLRVTADATMAGGRITASPLVVEKAGTEIRVTGGYTLYENTLDTELAATSPNLAQVLAPFGIPVVSGKTELSAHVAGHVMRLAISAGLKSNHFRYEDISLGNVSLDARLAASGKVTIDRLRIKNQESIVRAEGTVNLFDGSFADVNYTLPARLKATFEQVVASNFTPDLPVAGVLDGEMHLTNTIANPDVDLRVKAKELVYQETDYGDLTASVALSNGEVKIESLSLEKDQSRLKLKGLLDLMNPAAFPAGGSAPGPGASVQTDNPGPGASGTIEWIPAAAPIPEVLPVQNEKRQKFNLFRDGLSIETPSLDVQFEDTVIYAEDFTELVSGKLLVDGRITGPVDNISASLRIKGNQLISGEFTIGDLAADIAVDDRVVRLDPVILKTGRSELAVTGTVRPFQPDSMTISDNPAVDLDISGKEIFLGDIEPKLSGRLAINGDIRGTLENLRGTQTVTGHKIDLGVQKFEGIRVETRLDGNRVYIEPAVLSITTEDRITAGGWIALDGRYELRVGSDPIELVKIRAFRRADMTGGTFTLEASGAGTFDNPQLTGAVRLAGLQFEERPVPDIDVQLTLRNHLARIDAENGFSVNGRYHLVNRNFSVSADFDRTALNPYFNIGGLPELRGRLTGALDASGNVSNLSNATVRLSISNLAIFQNRIPLIRTAGLQAILENGTYSITETQLKLMDSGRLSIGGSGNLRGSLDLHADGTIPFRVISAFVETIDNPTGNIGIAARLGGTVNDPEFQGAIDLDQVGMILPVLLQTLHDVNGRIRITEKTIEFEDVTGGVDTGTLTLTGGFDLENLRPVRANLNLKARTLPLEIPDTLELLVNSTLTLKGTPGDSRLTGRITALEGLYYKDIKLDLLGTITEIGRRQRDIEPPVEDWDYDLPFLRNLKLDVVVAYRNPIMVDNNLALLSLRPELRIGGILNRPLLNGRADVSDGTITYRNTEFEVERGVIDFINPYRIVPTIDIRALSEVRQWSIILSVSGTPQNLDFKLSSDPSENDADILSLLLTGKTTLELEEGGGGGTTSPQEMLANIVADRFGQDIKETTGLDIEFEYGGDATDIGPDSRLTRNGGTAGTTGEVTDDTAAGENIRVTVGKELSRRISIMYGMERKSGEVVHQQTAVYKLLENLSVNAFQDTEGTFGGELRYRLEFR